MDHDRADSNSHWLEIKAKRCIWCDRLPCQRMWVRLAVPKIAMSDPNPTRPQMPTAAQIAREIELLNKAKNETEFREEVLLGQQRLEMSIEELRRVVQGHISEDKAEFNNVNITVSEHDKYIRYVLGAIGLITGISAIGGLLMWIIRKASQE